MRYLIVLPLLLFAAPSYAAITFRCDLATPTDNGTLSDATGNITVDKDAGCLSTAQSGDLVIIQVVQRDGNPTITVGTSGGQSWTAEAINSPGASVSGYVFWARFNGTWSADPVFSSTANFGGAISAIAMVYIPTNAANTWAVDVAQSLGSATPTTPFDVTATGQTAVAASTITGVCWFLTNSTATTWTLQTGGWTNPNSEAQWRNQQGTDTSVSCAYKINTSAGATGNVANRQGTATNITTYWNIETFAEVAAPAFTVAPNVSATSATGYTISFTAAQSSSTVYCIARKKGSSAASATQIQNGQDSTGSAAIASANKSVGTSADSLTLGSSLDYPTHDIDCIVRASSANSSVTTLSDKLKSAPSGYLYDDLSSVGTGSFCEPITSPAVAAGDIVERYSVTSPGSFSAPALNTCHVSYSGDDSRQLICYRIYDDSAQDWMSISSPSAQCTGTRAAVWFNNQAPFALFAPHAVKFFLHEGQAMTPQDLTIYCDDADDAQNTIVVTNVDALPANLSITNSVLSGTPAARGVTTGITFRCTDITGASVDWE